MIPAPLLYLAQMQLALLLLLGVYYLALRRLTFHRLNRFYLLGSLALAALYPALDLSALSLRAAPAAAARRLNLLPLLQEGAAGAAPAPSAALSAETWWLLAYGAGAALMLGLLLVQAAALWRLHRASRPVRQPGAAFRAVQAPVSPFSFGRHIYLNPARHAADELPAILLHERVHVRQLHSLDTLLAHLHRALAWASPAAWLWLRAVQENLEFIADAAVLRESELPAKTYQYSLLRLSTLGAAPAFTTPFSFITLKNRIQMMNTPESSPRQLTRYAAGLGLLLLLAAACATPKATETPQPRPNATAAARGLDKLTYLLDGRPATEAEVFAQESNLLTMHIYKGNKPGQRADLEALRRDYGSRLDDGLMFAFTKAGVNTPAVQELKTKYGIQIGDPATLEKHKTSTEAMYRKLLDGKGLSDEEIGGRLVLIDQQPATAEQLRALPPSVITGFAVGDGPVKKFGEAGRKGTVIVMTNRPGARDQASSPAGGMDQAQYYLDGQPISKAAAEQLNPGDISSMRVFKGEQARSFASASEPNPRPVILIVTKANEKSDAVKAFNQKHHVE
ncbi:M56 family metallopeptidase [Hymenobacter gummosus]|uniref:M56 family metallopeptidase n=1 Tax=Hymenobacter gummosus TaxID=1776032 RepID=A0A431U0T6_9BACT|nr:M56 family metallopeptidase [Hymenobacter gummosus]RTQ48553.1 M56 family metallopeptidase [Hymenobacter gummosus]